MPLSNLLNRLNDNGALLYEHSDAPGELRVRKRLLKHCYEFPETYWVLKETPYSVLVRKVK